MSLYFCGRLFSSESFSLFTCRTRTHRTLVCSFISLCTALFSDSTHRTSVCSFCVGMEFFVRYDIVLLPTFPPVRHFLRFDLTFRTHRHTPSPAVASAPPPYFFSVSFAVFVSLSFPIFHLAPRIVVFSAFGIHRSRPPASLFPLDSVQLHPSPTFRLCFVFYFPFCFSASPPSLPLTVY